MFDIKIVLFLSMLICGCAASTPKVNQGTVQEADQRINQSISIKPVREALGAYYCCLQIKVKPYLNTKATPKSIADAVAKDCEPQLSDYKVGVRDIYAKVYNSELKEYPDILKTKPEKHASRVRENGKRATIVRVMSARENGTKRAKTAVGAKSTTR